MMLKIKDSLFSKCLQALLIGYFLLSSINVTNSFKGLVTENDDIHRTEGTVGLILKKIFKCNGCTEEFDDYETKAGNNNKSLLVFDYIVPGHTWLIPLHNFTNLKGGHYSANTVLMCSFYCKIHVPPPEVTI